MSMRAKARQNLMVAAVNAAIEQGVITLECEPVTSAVFEFVLGPYPVIASVSDAGFDEVSIHVIALPTALGRRFVEAAVFYEHKKFGGAYASGWLERRDGKYLQSGFIYYGRKTVTEVLSMLTVKPLGFGTHPIKGRYDYRREFEAIFGPIRGQR